MASARERLREDLEARILRLIGENPRVSQRDVARRLEISVGAVHYCLRALADKGLVKIDNFKASQNRRNYVYLLTPQGMTAKAALTVDFLRRKLAEYEALRAEISDLEREVAGGGLAAGDRLRPDRRP